MKNKLKKIFVFVLILPIVFFSGCMFFDENNDTTQSDSILGYKVCYNDNNYELDNTFELYSVHILTELYANFGLPNDSTYQSSLTNKVKAELPKNYDRIRQQLNSSDNYIDTPWNWTISTTIENAGVCTDAENALSFYENIDKVAYYTHFINAYKIPMQIVCMQICMGENISNFTVSTTESTGSASVYLESTHNLANENALSSVKELFKTKGNYIGFTADNLTLFKNYLLQKVIGNNVVSTDFDSNIATTNGNKSYEEIITEILELNPDSLAKSFYEPYPTCKIIDVKNALYIQSSGDALSHITAYEYNSITVMASKEYSISTFFMCMEAEQDLNITIKVSVYKNNLLDEVGSITINLKANENTNLFSPPFSTQTITEFNNQLGDGILSASGSGKVINNTNQNSKYFKLNSNKVAVLDNNAVGSSYFEITFEVEGSENLYTPFKVGLF